MTLREYYNDLPRAKQDAFRKKWIERTSKSKSSFYNMLDNDYSELQIFASTTGIEPILLHKGSSKQLDVFMNSKRYKKHAN